jgi:mannose-6-phosphate isomerase-like protein (cupin superfamily)
MADDQSIQWDSEAGVIHGTETAEAAVDPSPDGAASTRRRRGIRLYPGADAVDNASTGFRGESKDSVETRQRLVELHAAGHGLGFQSKLLFRQSNDDGGFSGLLVWGKPNYPLPRHSHETDCMYVVISGSATMGNVTLRPGDSFFAPSGAMYQYRAGPEGVEVLEVRHGVDVIGTEMAEMSAETAEAVRQTVIANRETWAGMHVSPLLAANARRAE